MGFKIPLLEHGHEILTSPYGPRTLNGRTYFHRGVDVVSGLRGKDGSKLADGVVSIGDGKVIATGYDTLRGYYVRVEHTPHLVSHYQHLAKGSICVKIGQSVKKGSVLGHVGYTGECVPKGIGGRHLDFRIIIDDEYTNPLPYLNGEKAINPAPFKPFMVTPTRPYLTIRETPNGADTGNKLSFKSIVQVKLVKHDAQGRDWYHISTKTGIGYVAGWLCRKI